LEKLPSTRQPENSSQTMTGEHRQAINALFATMKVAYPHFLKDQLESDAKRMWALHLNDFSVNRIEVAAMAMVDSHPSFAPTIGEFKVILEELSVAPQYDESPRLERTWDNSEYARVRRIACARYAGKVCGMSLIATEYSGPFPMDEFINQIDIPAPNTRPGLDPKHKRAWNIFYKVFDEIWATEN